MNSIKTFSETFIHSANVRGMLSVLVVVIIIGIRAKGATFV